MANTDLSIWYQCIPNMCIVLAQCLVLVDRTLMLVSAYYKKHKTAEVFATNDLHCTVHMHMHACTLVICDISEYE